jgi:regulator of sigma E protease
LDNHEGNQPESMKPLPGNTPPHDPAKPLDTDAPEEDPGLWTTWNIGVLALLVCLVFYLLFKFTFNEMGAIVKAVLGLSFVIFIHELGHFLAAKWSNVHVTTFSIGFGPPIPGCHFTWGETTYKLAILPLGGYVQMVGQVDGDEASDGNDDDPRSYRKKTVGQRMLIISAGVIMNAILALCCFIAIYEGPGKEHNAAVVNIVDTSAPAFKYGLKSSAAITKLGAVDNPNFSDLTQIVINSRAGNPIPVTYEAPGEKAVSTAIEPRMDENNSKAVIGVSPPPRLQFIPKRGLQEGPYFAGTPAGTAKFEYGDVIIAMTDPDDPAQAKEYRTDRITEIRDDPRYPEHGQRDYFEFMRRMQLLADKDIIVRVRRGTEKDAKDVAVKVAPMFRTNLGVVMKMGPVVAVRDGSAADKVVLPANPEKKLEADLIEAVSVVDADGKVLEFKGNTLDPERLPLELRRWSDRLDKANFKDKRLVTLQLRRHKLPDGNDQFASVKQELAWDTSWRFDRAAPISLNAPMPIPELGLAYEIKSIVVAVTDPKSSLQVGDVVKNIRYDVEGFEEEIPWLRSAVYQVAPFLRPVQTTDIQVDWMKKDLKEGQWAHISFQIFQRPYKFKKLVFKVERNKAIQDVEMPLLADETWPLLDRGWLFANDTRRVTASDPLHAIWLGAVDTKSRMMEIFLNLRGMVLGRISPTNLGGPLTIAYATYRFAGMDFADFTFFLGLISINLAVVNFLPIPVLDGGHMVFLIYEKIRKQPASEGVRIAATYVGLGMILMLMVFVLSLDVIRMFFSS